MRPFLTLHNPADSAAYYGSGLWQSETFYSLLRHNAEAFGDDLALVDSRRRLTWREVQDAADGVAAELRSFGLVAGDRVCAWMSNRVELVLLMLACSREGFACNPSLHRSHTSREIGAFLQELRARALFSETGWGADRDRVKLDTILTEVSSLRAIFDETNFPRPAPNLTEWNRDPDRVGYLAFTSGTTGIPKCVMHSANTLLANARELARDWKVVRGTVILSLSPLSHHIAWVAFGQWLLSGCRLVTNDPPAGQSMLDWVNTSGATYLMGVPTHAIDLLREQAGTGKGFGGVTTFYMAGAAIPPSICETLIGQGITPQNVYGMTENSSHQYTLPDDSAATIVNTCGRGGQAYRIRIFDLADPNRAVPTGEVGEIGGKGAALMLGYFNNQVETEVGFNDDGWFLSGDLGRLDAAGNLTVVGRLKDTINRGGHKIYPAYIEELALRHPGVEKAACVAVPDARLGERVCLAISGPAAAERLLDHLRSAGLSKYDMPEFFLRMESFPMTASGKVLKRSLTEMVQRRRVVPEPVGGGRH